MRKAYTTPRLIVHGSVERITLMGPGNVGNGEPPPAADFGLSTACHAGSNANPCTYSGNN